MTENYQDCITKVSDLIFNTILEKEENLTAQFFLLDGTVLSILREIGLKVMSMLLSLIVAQITLKAKKKGFVVHRKPTINYTTIFGQIKLESPYLWNRQSKKGIRPVKEKLGINAGDCSLKVGRALTEFGCEDSFQLAAKRFEEHYGFWVEKSWLEREVKDKAKLAEDYVAKILKEAEENAPNKVDKKSDRILLQLDGSMIRTGVYSLAKKRKRTPKRKLLKKTRKIDWVEVRVGFVRPVEQKEKRTFIARYGKYPELAKNLKSAAYLQGFSGKSQIFAVADGGPGLKEALEAEFPNLQFILDKAHLLQHLYQGAEALKIGKKQRSNWVNYLLNLLEREPVTTVTNKMRQLEVKRIDQLANHLDRFQNSIQYQKFRSLGLPIGSGEIESSHKYIPQKRLKIPGATWHPDSLNPMLALRVLKANCWWQDFWQELHTQSLV